jgi:hypothetical protein
MQQSYEKCLARQLNITESGKRKVTPVRNETPRHEDVWGNEGIAANILSLGNTRIWVVSFTLQPFYPQGTNHPVPIGQGTGRTPEAVSMLSRNDISLGPAWNRVPISEV